MSVMKAMIKLTLFLIMFNFALVAGGEERNTKDWYKTAVIYQIYTRSFKDSNGDGIGDLKGITEKLDFIQDMGYDTIWVQAFFKSPMADFGYDISDFRAVDPIFGTIHDLRILVDSIHDRGMRVILDFVPNHTSNASEWFQKSINREEPYTDYYIWKDPKGYDIEGRPIPPNNWVSLFGHSAWIWNSKREQFYYRFFTVSQPDLNFRNPKVRTAMEDVIRFWLDFGVDGFRVDSVDTFFEDEYLTDTPDIIVDTRDWSQFPYQAFLEENFHLTHRWREIVDEYKVKDNKTRILTAEALRGPEQLIRWFGNETYPNCHFPLYLEFPRSLDFWKNATTFDEMIRDYTDIIPSFGVANWGMSNHDTSRLTARIDPEFSEAGMMITLLLPGNAVIFYGEEIGLKNTQIRPDQRQDKTRPERRPDQSRDKSRAPMQWDDTNNAGFTTNKKTWLPVSADYWRRNVKNQLQDPRSPLNTVKRLINLRKVPVIEEGDLDSCVVSEWVHMFVRKLENEPPIVVIVNLGSETETVCLDDCPHISYLLPEVMAVHTCSQNSRYRIGDEITILQTGGKPCSTLRPKAGVVLTPVGKYATGQATKTSNIFLMSLLTSLCVTLFSHR